jgi:hypothetical protein
MARSIGSMLKKQSALWIDDEPKKTKAAGDGTKGRKSDREKEKRRKVEMTRRRIRIRIRTERRIETRTERRIEIRMKRIHLQPRPLKYVYSRGTLCHCHCC